MGILDVFGGTSQQDINDEFANSLEKTLNSPMQIQRRKKNEPSSVPLKTDPVIPVDNKLADAVIENKDMIKQETAKDPNLSLQVKTKISRALDDDKSLRNSGRRLQMAVAEPAKVAENIEEKPLSAKDQFMDALVYFSPQIIGGLVGSLGGEGDAGALMGMEKGGQLRDQYLKNISDRAEAKAKAKKDAEEIALKKKQENFSEQKDISTAMREDRALNLKEAAMQSEFELMSKKAENGKPGKGSEFTDKAYAPKYVEWVENGRDLALNDQKTLDKVLFKITKGQPVGSRIMPQLIRSFSSPEGELMREQVQGIALRQMKAIMGGNPTENDRKVLENLAYNPQLTRKQNAEKLADSLEYIQRRIKTNEAMSKYWRTHGNTLDGYTPEQISTEVEPKDMNEADAKAASLLNRLLGKGGAVQ